MSDEVIQVHVVLKPQAGYENVPATAQNIEQMIPRQEDRTRVAMWLHSVGLQTTVLAHSFSVTIGGTKQDLEFIFRSTIDLYDLSGKTFYRWSSEPILPDDIVGLVESVVFPAPVASLQLKEVTHG